MVVLWEVLKRDLKEVQNRGRADGFLFYARAREALPNPGNPWIPGFRPSWGSPILAPFWTPSNQPFPECYNMEIHGDALLLNTGVRYIPASTVSA